MTEPLLGCTAANDDQIAEALSFAYATHCYQRNATKREREHQRSKRRCRKVVPVILTALEDVKYSAYPTPGEVFEAEAKCKAACSAFFNPITLWLLGHLLEWLIPVLVRWWFSDRSQKRRVMAARRVGQ